MAVKVPMRFDDSRLPLSLGNPLKVPSYAWKNWGICYDLKREFDQLVTVSEELYREEWDNTGGERHRCIAQASKMAGLEDANERLNSAVANFASRIIAEPEEQYTIVDLGAGTGNTTLSIFHTLKRVSREKVFFVLVEPARDAIQEAKDRLREAGLMEDKQFEVVATNDLGAPKYIPAESVDLVMAVASIHHHAYLEAPFRIVHTMCKKGGFFLTGDWHNSMWEHPRNVYELLEEMEWETKGDDLKVFLNTYPKAREQETKKIGRSEIRANDQIKMFWKHYSKLKIEKTNQSMILEGHRPVDKYLECMQKVGFLTNTEEIEKAMKKNPDMVLPDSSLLCLCLGQKGG